MLAIITDNSVIVKAMLKRPPEPANMKVPRNIGYKLNVKTLKGRGLNVSFENMRPGLTLIFVESIQDYYHHFWLTSTRHHYHS